MLERGRIVKSLAGRDKGYYLAVMQVENGCIIICDGKERPIDRPKSKNIRHVEATEFSLSETELASNRALRKALRRLSSEFNVNT